jgi:hypothetical protein
MATLWKHYTLAGVKLGAVFISAVHGLRCSACYEDFHIDRNPLHCPFCGRKFVGVKPFGVRIETREEEIRDEHQVIAMLKELKVTAAEILALAQQETQDIASLKQITQVAADKVKAAAQRMNDAIAALTSGTANIAQLNAIASELATHHNELQAVSDALAGIGATADAEQPPANPTEGATPITSGGDTATSSSSLPSDQASVTPSSEPSPSSAATTDPTSAPSDTASGSSETAPSSSTPSASASSSNSSPNSSEEPTSSSPSADTNAEGVTA